MADRDKFVNEDVRELGGTGLSVSPIGLGTWPMSGKWWGHADDVESVDVIREALDRGINLIDTAEGYGDGHAEKLVAQAVRGRRDDAVIASKVLAWNLDPVQLRASFEGSCRRMGTDYIDIYFIHWPNPDFSIEETMSVLEGLRTQGSIRAIGASNFDRSDLELAREFGEIDVVQPPYNMFWREPERETLDYCREQGLGVITYSGLAQGLLTGALRADTAFDEGDERRSTVLFQADMYKRCIAAVDALAEVALGYGKSVAQLAIRWLTTRRGVTSGLMGVRTSPELDENLGGLGWEISMSDLELIDSLTLPIWNDVSEQPDMFGRWRKFGSPRLQREGS